MNKQSPRSEFGVSRRDLIAALRRLRRGDFTVRLAEDGPEADNEIAMLFNEVVGFNQQITEEFERLSKVVGKEGKIGHRAKVRGATGGWDTKLKAVNDLIDDMVQPITEVARVIGSVAKGDLSQSMTVEIDGRPLRGDFLRIGKVVNTMVEQLASFTSEVTRVAREVGTEGKLGGQANVKGVAGTWKDLTDNVNLMAANLTGQVRNIADVTTAVARGDSAIAALNDTGRSYDLLLTDFAMPGRNGVETIRSARETRPDLRAVLMTGYADDESVASMRDAIAVLRKPIDLRELVKALA